MLLLSILSRKPVFIINFSVRYFIFITSVTLVYTIYRTPQSRPHSPCVQCAYAHLYRSASAAGWLITPTVTRHRPAGQPVSITGQPARPTTDTPWSPSQTRVILIVVLVLISFVFFC